jgi:hypothetical protein
MNSIDRSGDIVLLFRDIMNDETQNRYTSGVSCKSWHGSLNPSDSYVPFMVAYPGGNIDEVGSLVDSAQACSLSDGCDGNWRATELIKTIINKQY